VGKHRGAVVEAVVMEQIKTQLKGLTLAEAREVMREGGYNPGPLATMPERDEKTDPPIGLRRDALLGHWVLRFEPQAVLAMTDNTAWRLFGLLALQLGVELPEGLEQTIRF
jgi:hypothetical protein